MEQERYERSVEWGYRIVFATGVITAALWLWRIISS